MNTELLTLTPAEFCAATDACSQGREWAITQPDMAAVWDNCPKAKWMLWLLDKLGHEPARQLRLFAVWCARNTPLGDGRVTGDLLTDSRSLAALDVAERYAHGLATDKELAVACDAARAAFAAVTTADAYAAQAAAAYAATHAAVNAAHDAAVYAADAAYAACRASDAYAAADAVQADQLRRMIDNPFRAKEAKS